MVTTTYEKLKTYPQLYSYNQMKESSAGTYTYLKGVTPEEIEEIEHKNSIIEYTLLNHSYYHDDKYSGALRIKNI